jgi:cell division transport system permease protein
MEIRAALARAKRSLREDLRLHAVAVTSLVVAFVCLGAGLLAVTNLTRITGRWGSSQHLTVYLVGDAKESQVAQLRLVLESLAEVARVDHVTAAQARNEFLSRNDLGAALGSVPDEAFPASLEVALRAGANPERVAQLSDRVRKFAGVEEVETYHEWFTRLADLRQATSFAVAFLAVLVGLCAFAIIGNTIRLALASRRREIEVLKLCGATNAFVRAPFLLEGVVQGTIASSLAMMLLFLAHVALRGHVDAALASIIGMHVAFLHPFALLGIVVGGAVAGGLGSALSVRRYLVV